MNEERESTDEAIYTTKGAAEQLGVSIYVVRRLCNSGLIPYVRRNHFGHRTLTAEQVSYAGLIIGLERAGMRRPELRRFTKLYRQGDNVLKERKAFLETQKRQLWQELDARKRGIDLIERHIELIDEKMQNRN